MKIAVISDIHGNMEALEAVMDDIKKQKCDKIFVLGDYAMAGPEPKAAVDYFMKQINNRDFVMIQGNTDVMVANYNFDLYDSLQEKAPIMAEALKDDAKLLDAYEKLFLKTLPVQREVTEGGIKFLLVHGSPRRNNEDIIAGTPMKEIEAMLSGVDADVVLCGHTHIPCGFQTDSKKTVVNAGSVGRPFTHEPKACYLTIDVSDGKCEYEHHFLSYNNQQAADKLKKRNIWGADTLANTLLNPEKRHF